MTNMGPVSIWGIRRDLRLADSLALAAAQAAGRQVIPVFVLDPRLLQGKKFDPRGEYVRRWIPELATSRSNTCTHLGRCSHPYRRRSGCESG